MRRYPQVGFSAARRSASRQSSADVDGRPGGRCGWVQCPTMRRRCQRNSVSGVTSHPARLGRGSAAAIAASKVRSVSASSGRSTWRRNTASWWRNTIISRFFERPDRTVSRASDARNRYKIRYTTNQHRPASRQVNDHGRVSGTHRVHPAERGLQRGPFGVTQRHSGHRASDIMTVIHPHKAGGCGQYRCERCIGSVYRVRRSLIDSTAALLGLPSAPRPTTSLRALRRHRFGWCQCP